MKNIYIYCWEDIITSKATLILETTVAAERGSANEMTGKRKMRKSAGIKMKALIEKEVAGSCRSNDSDTDVDIFDENTSNNSVEERNCNKDDLSLDRSQKNLETETNITISTENININISNNILQFTNVQPEKTQEKFVTVELFNTFYDDYIEYKYKHYINDILENFN